VKIQVRFYAGLRYRVGVDRLPLDLPEGATVEDVLDALVKMFPDKLGRLKKLLGYSYWVAKNGLQVSLTEELKEGDEIVIFPPISGG